MKTFKPERNWDLYSEKKEIFIQQLVQYVMYYDGTYLVKRKEGLKLKNRVGIILQSLLKSRLREKFKSDD